MKSAQALVVLVAAAAGIAATVSLGNWQTRRAEQKLALQAQRDAAERAAPIEVSARDLADLPRRAPLRVKLRGRFAHEQTVWLDNRMMDGRAGFVVVTPLRVEGTETAILVMRGFVARDPADRQRLPAIGEPQGEVVLEGLALAEAPRLLELGAAPPPGPLPAIWQNLDYAAFEQASGRRVARIVVQQTSDGGDGLARRWPRPSAGVEKHRGYAFQWYALAVLLTVLAAVVLFRGRTRAKKATSWTR
ncbi:MAG: SURF1-like protein [Betaproteobacteria bacterium]|nr:MAG: SURF1-like protein [Betaproteobacteria bacterium]